jgi:hypothetical protein
LRNGAVHVSLAKFGGVTQEILASRGQRTDLHPDGQTLLRVSGSKQLSRTNCG